MTGFILRKLGHSLLVLLGVLLLTFVMFQMAAGDPAAAVLGKNPAPAEIESLRRELQSDLPLFWGHWRASEVFASARFDGPPRQLPGVDFPASVEFGGGVRLAAGEAVTLTRRFAVPEAVRLRLSGAGGWRLADGRMVELGEGPGALAWENAPETVTLTAGPGGARLDEIICERYQANAWNSQLRGALLELVRPQSEFPYVSVLNFGRTITTREPINRIIARGIGPSLAVMLPVFLGELLLGIGLALLATAVKDTIFDRLLLVFAVAAMSVSYLVLIIAGQWFFGYYLNWFPVWGWGGWRYLALPVVIGVASGLGGGVRFYRTVFVNELKSEYLRTAAAKGCSPWIVFNKHLLRNALIPIIARASALLPFIFTGSLLLESFFGIPGLGYASIDALNNSDLALLKALTIVNALLFVAINLAADLLCAWADPRVRLNDLR